MVISKGYWAEFRDAFGLQRLHEQAAVWTIYHAIDAELHDPFTGWQALNYIEHEIPHIPLKINTKGLSKNDMPEADLAVISTSNWQPYVWSVNNVAFSEIMHTALACFQGGRPEMGFKLMKSAIMDGMYLGGSPGNVGQVSYYDAARGEVYRDFADVVGVYSRAMVQGLFGIEPDLLHNKVYLRPGFPAQWEKASIEIRTLVTVSNAKERPAAGKYIPASVVTWITYWNYLCAMTKFLWSGLTEQSWPM